MSGMLLDNQWQNTPFPLTAVNQLTCFPATGVAEHHQKTLKNNMLSMHQHCIKCLAPNCVAAGTFEKRGGVILQCISFVGA